MFGKEKYSGVIGIEVDRLKVTTREIRMDFQTT